MAHDVSQVAVVDDGELLVLAFALADGTVISWQRARPSGAPACLVVDPGQVAVEDAVQAVEIDEYRASVTLGLAEAAARAFGTSAEVARDLRSADPDWAGRPGRHDLPPARSAVTSPEHGLSEGRRDSTALVGAGRPRRRARAGGRGRGRAPERTTA